MDSLLKTGSDLLGKAKALYNNYGDWESLTL